MIEYFVGKAPEEFFHTRITRFVMLQVGGLIPQDVSLVSTGQFLLDGQRYFQLFADCSLDILFIASISLAKPKAASSTSERGRVRWQLTTCASS